MSVVRCCRCHEQIDTDMEDVHEARIGEDLEPMHELCFAAHDSEEMAYGRSLAAEHHSNLNARGCTCRWVGHANDPDAHIQRDDWCPVHGKDPDAERQRIMDERYD